MPRFKPNTVLLILICFFSIQSSAQIFNALSFYRQEVAEFEKRLEKETALYKWTGNSVKRDELFASPAAGQYPINLIDGQKKNESSSLSLHSISRLVEKYNNYEKKYVRFGIVPPKIQIYLHKKGTFASFP